MPAASASSAVWVAPAEPFRMKARQTSEPAVTISALRRNPTDRPYLTQSAGCRSTWPPQWRHICSARESAPVGHAPLTMTPGSVAPDFTQGASDSLQVGPRSGTR